MIIFDQFDSKILPNIERWLSNENNNFLPAVLGCLSPALEKIFESLKTFADCEQGDDCLMPYGFDYAISLAVSAMGRETVQLYFEDSSADALWQHVSECNDSDISNITLHLERFPNTHIFITEGSAANMGQHYCVGFLVGLIILGVVERDCLRQSFDDEVVLL